MSLDGFYSGDQVESMQEKKQREKTIEILKELLEDLEAIENNVWATIRELSK